MAATNYPDTFASQGTPLGAFQPPQAAVFRQRAQPEPQIPSPEPDPVSFVDSVPVAPVSPPGRDIRFAVTLAAGMTLLLLSAWLLVRQIRDRVSPTPGRAETLEMNPSVRQFWSQVFPADRQSDIVMDDAGIALYQELTHSTV